MAAEEAVLAREHEVRGACLPNARRPPRAAPHPDARRAARSRLPRTGASSAASSSEPPFDPLQRRLDFLRDEAVVVEERQPVEARRSGRAPQHAEHAERIGDDRDLRVHEHLGAGRVAIAQPPEAVGLEEAGKGAQPAGARAVVPVRGVDEHRRRIARPQRPLDGARIRQAWTLGEAAPDRQPGACHDQQHAEASQGASHRATGGCVTRRRRRGRGTASIRRGRSAR
jgi:hypothetical protein